MSDATASLIASEFSELVDAFMTNQMISVNSAEDASTEFKVFKALEKHLKDDYPDMRKAEVKTILKSRMVFPTSRGARSRARMALAPKSWLQLKH